MPHMACGKPLACRHILLLLAAAVLCGMAVREVEARSSTQRSFSMTPVTNFTTFRPRNAEYIRYLSSLPIKTAYANYLIAARLPFIPTDTRKMAKFQESLRQLVQTSSSTKLRHTFGISAFTQMNFTERARYLSLRKKGKTRAETVAENAEFLRKTARITLAEMEAAADRIYAETAAMRTTVAQDDFNFEWAKFWQNTKNQGNDCQSGWAFAAAAVAEGASTAVTNYPISLSAKELLDCDPGNPDGCRGGSLEPAFKYMIKNGISDDNRVPYVGQVGTCPRNLQPASRLASYKRLPSDEAAMYEALKKAPIAVELTIDDGLFAYTGGVYSSSTCSGPVNHAAVIIGAGVFPDTNEPYWLLRMSWGDNWGAGGTMMILRNYQKIDMKGMCNIAASPYQVESADTPSAPPPVAPGEDPGCTDTTVTVTDTTSLADLAKQYKTTIAKIQLDNGLQDSSATQLQSGTQLSIVCPSGIWSVPYGIWPKNGLDWNSANGMVAAPTECICPEGQYVTRVEVTPSLYYRAGNFTGSTYVGSVKIICQGGDLDQSECIVDAQPGTDTATMGLESGSQAQINGFASIPMKRSFAIDSLFGVGAQTGGEDIFRCPENMVLTGIAGGASPIEYLKPENNQQSYISGLQFRCSNYFGLPTDNNAVAKLRSVLKAPFPRVSFSISCRVANLTSYADKDLNWQSIAARNSVLVNELIRVNPNINMPITRRSNVFLPPCNDGEYFTLKQRANRMRFARAISQDLPLDEASAAVTVVDLRALVAAEADA